jgi:hypothetical protein
MKKKSFIKDITTCLEDLLERLLTSDEMKRNQYARIKKVQDIINNYFDHILRGLLHGSSEQDD